MHLVIFDFYSLRMLEVPGYEADDVIGTLSVKGAEAGYEVYMGPVIVLLPGMLRD